MSKESMPNIEAIQMMKRVVAEIRELRQRVAYLEPKADAYDKMSVVLSLLPQRSQGYAPDITYELEKRIAELIEPKKEEA